MASRLASRYPSDWASTLRASRSSAANALMVEMPPRFPARVADRSPARSRTRAYSGWSRRW